MARSRSLACPRPDQRSTEPSHGHLHGDQQQRQQLQTLAEIQTRVSTAGLDLQALRDRVADIARAVTGADGAAIEEPEDSEMVYTATSGRAAGSPGIRLPISGSLSGLCYRQHESIYCRDTHEDTRVARDPLCQPSCPVGDFA